MPVEFFRETGRQFLKSGELSPSLRVRLFCGCGQATCPSMRRGRDEDECGECDALGGESEDEDGGGGFHGGIFPFVMFFVRVLPHDGFVSVCAVCAVAGGWTR